MFFQDVASPIERRSKLIAALSDFQMAAPIVHEVGSIPSVHHTPPSRKHFLYRFSYRGSLIPDYPAWGGVPHGIDIPFVFGLPPEAHFIWLAGHQATHTDQKVAEMMVKMWSNFARYGHPMQQSPVQSGTRWPEYSHGQRLIMDIKESLTVQTVDWMEPDDVFQLMKKRLF